MIGQQAFRTVRTSTSLAIYAFWASSVVVFSTDFQASLNATPTNGNKVQLADVKARGQDIRG